jgi:predicted  nucleic acid-binding Zn-ribbon protein
MLTDKDINKLIQVLATKDDVRRLEERVGNLEEMMQRVLSALDRLATQFEKLNIEYAAISEQLSRHDRWIREIAKKAKVPLSD